MADTLTQIRGTTQIKPGTVTNNEIAADANLELTKLDLGEILVNIAKDPVQGQMSLSRDPDGNVATMTTQFPSGLTRVVEIRRTGCEVSSLKSHLSSETIARIFTLVRDAYGQVMGISVSTEAA
jgi:hypothetical protein